MAFPRETWTWAQQTKKLIERAAYYSKNPLAQTKQPLIAPKSIKKDIGISRLEDFLTPTILPQKIPETILEDKVLAAQTIFHTMGHKYGFKEALNTGNFMPYPHELSEVTCSTQMLVNYVIAKECGLKPVIREVIGFRTAGSSFIANHTFIEVDVGEKFPWMLCQSWKLLGPIIWDVVLKKIKVTDYSDKKAIDKPVHEIEYTLVETYTEQQYEEWAEYLRSERGAAHVLIPGQRAGFPDVDGWKSEKKLKAAWYIKYEPNKKSLHSKISLQRPLVQNRGLENTLIFNDKSELEREELIGYFYKADGWAEFISKIPIVTICANTAEKLIEDVASFNLQKQYEFEKSVAQSILERKTNEEPQIYEKAIRESFETLQKSPTFPSLWKFVLVESLYQQAKKETAKDFIYSSGQRFNAFKLFDQTGEDAKYEEDRKKMIAKLKNRIEGLDRRLSAGRYVSRNSSGWMRILDTRRSEYEEVRRFVNIRNSNELSLYQLEHEAQFCDEAADRALYVKDFVQKNAATLQSLEQYTHQKLGQNFDTQIIAAYGKMFIEFLGMMAHAWKELRLEPYRETLISKVKNFNGDFKG